METAQAFYDAESNDKENTCQLLEEIEHEYGVTHMVVKSEKAFLDCPFVSPTYAQRKFTVFAIERP
jgi:hypothetical protein